LNQLKKQYYKEQLTTKKAALDEAQTALATMVEDGVESFTFDTGTYGARQHVKKLNLKEMQDYVRILESQYERLLTICGGTGLMRFKMNRHGGR
jgi:hypothetical protein